MGCVPSCNVPAYLPQVVAALQGIRQALEYRHENDLLRLDELYNHLEAATPPANIPPLGVDLSSADGCLMVVRIIVSNFLTWQQQIMVKYWRVFFSTLLKATGLENAFSTILQLSLLLTMSRMDSRLIQDLVEFVQHIHGEVLHRGLPHIVVNMLQSPRATQAFNTAVPSLDTSSIEFHIPPRIIVARYLPNILAGFVCLDGYICVREEELNCRNACDTLNLVNVVGHVTMHAILCRVTDNVNIHMPDLYDSPHGQGAGELWERRFWYGMAPRWYSPGLRRDAEVLGNQIIADFWATGNVNLTDLQVRCLNADVGSLPVTVVGNALYVYLKRRICY